MVATKKIPTLSEKDKTRFWDKVDVCGEDECWEWTARIAGSGYGSFCLKNKETSVHRVAYFLTYGHITPGKFILHNCDNPPCCNPKHLYPGTQKNNMADMMVRGRQGFTPGSGVLKEEDVLKIIERCSFGETQISVALDYSVSQPLVSCIVNKKRWAYA